MIPTMSGRLGLSSHATARETTPNAMMRTPKAATGTYPDTHLLLGKIAPKGEYIAGVVGPEAEAPFRARRCAAADAQPPPEWVIERRHERCVGGGHESRRPSRHDHHRLRRRRGPHRLVGGHRPRAGEGRGAGAGAGGGAEVAAWAHV